MPRKWKQSVGISLSLHPFLIPMCMLPSLWLKLCLSPILGLTEYEANACPSLPPPPHYINYYLFPSVLPFLGLWYSMNIYNFVLWVRDLPITPVLDLIFYFLFVSFYFILHRVYAV